MKFKAYGINIRKEDYETIRGMMKLVASEIIDIYDLKSYELDIRYDDIVFVFGNKAEKLSKNIDCKAKLIFPDVDRLSKDVGDPEERQLAKEKLLLLKQAIENGSLEKKLVIVNEKQSETVTVEAIPDFTQLQALDQILQKKGIESWIGTSKNGKTVKLTKEPETNSADINMTFTEFYNLRKFMEVFNIKETKIVYKPIASDNKSDT
jgi:hypothetical protein